ncbi:hypothetical protein [Nostoc sp.]|uniref:hypothetical protein n=1 Tax=Nostoc sp. TaxID=1180 RepID=UPI0035948E3B
MSNQKLIMMLMVGIFLIAGSLGFALDFKSSDRLVSVNEILSQPTSLETNTCVEKNTPSFKIFADKLFYQESPDTEITLIGVLQTSPVRLGPNTRDMPFYLETSQESLSVYVTNTEQEILSSYINRQVKVIGKRIDQRNSGYGFEIWIGWIILCEE